MQQPFYEELDRLYRKILYRPVDPSGYETYSRLLRRREKSLREIAKILEESEESRQIAAARARARDFLENSQKRVASGEIRQATIPRGQPVTDDGNEVPGTPPGTLPPSAFVFASPEPVAKLQTPGSILLASDPGGSAHSVNESERRYATCSDIAWFDDETLVTVNLLGDALHVHRFDEEAGELVLLQTVTEGMNWPEAVAISPDGSTVAVTHSGGRGYVTVHEVEAGSRRLLPGGRLVEPEAIEEQLHGIAFAPDGRHLAFTYIGDPGGITVLDTETLDRTCRFVNRLDNLKPKSIDFSPDGSRALIAYAFNAGNFGMGNGALTLHSFDYANGTLEPVPLSTVSGRDLRDFNDPETLAFLPGGHHAVLTNLGGEFVSLIPINKDHIGTPRRLLGGEHLSFPHGIGASRRFDLVGITNYGDDTVQVHRLAALDSRILLLRRDPSRCAHVDRLLSPDLELNGIVEPTIIDACDGNSDAGLAEAASVLGLDPDRLRTEASAFMQRKLACSASHVKAWNSGCGSLPALVLEDDAVLADGCFEALPALIAAADRHHAGWHLIYLYSNCTLNDLDGVLVREFNEATADHHGNVGYIVSPAGAAALPDAIRGVVSGLSEAELKAEQHQPHYGHDLAIRELARKGEAKILWSTRLLVDTAGQVSAIGRPGDLESTIYTRT